jgi:Dienelactone hydrolase and related enzymes
MISYQNRDIAYGTAWPRDRRHKMVEDNSMAVIRRLAATATVLLLAGCAGGTTRTTVTASSAVPPSASPAPVDASCGASTAGAQTVRFGAAGATNLVGVVVGTGKTGVVLAHQSRGNRCQWGDYAHELAEAGYRSLIFDFAGSGLSTGSDANDAAVVAAAGYLRTQGVNTVVLIGASMGGTAVLAAAPQIAPPVAAVASLSGPARFDGVDAAEAVKKLTVPVLYAVCAGDSGFANDAQTLSDATRAGTDKKLLVLPNCNSHGVQLANRTGGPEATAVRAAIHDFLSAHAPA